MKSIIKLLRISAFINNFFDPAHLTGFKSDLNAMRMMSGFRQNISDNAASRFPIALVLLQHYVNCQAGFYIFPVFAAHR